MIVGQHWLLIPKLMTQLQITDFIAECDAVISENPINNQKAASSDQRALTQVG